MFWIVIKSLFRVWGLRFYFNLDIQVHINSLSLSLFLFTHAHIHTNTHTHTLTHPYPPTYTTHVHVRTCMSCMYCCWGPIMLPGLTILNHPITLHYTTFYFILWQKYNIRQNINIIWSDKSKSTQHNTTHNISYYYTLHRNITYYNIIQYNIT